MLCLLAVAAPACNWVFGIEGTVQADASVSADAALPTARLTYLVAVTDPSGVPAGIHEFRGILPAPKVRIGRVGEALTDARIDDAGSIDIPDEYQASTWRLVYQLEGDIPREMHWTTTAGQTPHAIVPLYGRIDRDPIPGVKTTMMLTPSGTSGPASYGGPIVYTTGLWTQSISPGPSTGATLTHDFNQSIQLSGPEGAPIAAKGDQVVLVDYMGEDACRVSKGSAAFTLTLSDGPSTTITDELWVKSRSTQTMSVYVGESYDRIRVTVAAQSTATRALQFGTAASTTMPAFTQRMPRQPRLDLHGPLLFPMLDCVGPTAVPLPFYNQPAAFTVFPQLGHVQMTASRLVVGGPRLHYGVAGVAPISGGGATFDTSVAMPEPPYLLGALDTALADHADLPAGTGPLVLTWTNELARSADYYEIVLHQVEFNRSVPVRAYTTTAQTLTLDRADLVKDLEYVFEIRAVLGAPFVQLADFTRYLPTQSTAVVWTHTFFAR